MAENKTKRGSLIVISGFSGVGKGTVVKRLVSDFGYNLSVSATTRSPRDGEVNGREYYFMDRSEFENLIDYGGFIEWTQYVENYYGTPKKYVEEGLEAGRDIILEIEVMGALNVKEQFPDALLIFISAPSIAELKNRLAGRGTESEEVIRNRLLRAAQEAEGIEEYDYLVVNDDLDTCVNEVHGIITSEHLKMRRRLEFVTNIREDLQGLMKGE